MKIVVVNGTTWLPLASLAGKSGTRTSDCRRRGQKQESDYARYFESNSNSVMCNVCGFMSCTNLWVLRKVSYGDFKWFQYSHDSGCWVVQKVPHTRLQKVGLCRCLGNCDSHLPEDVTYYYKTVLSLYIWLLVPSSIPHTRAQKLLIASGGNPLLLRAVKVKSRGSSQSL